MARGIMPYISWMSSLTSYYPLLIVSITSSGPSMLNVLPEPLYPYANIVPLNPFVNYSTVSLAAYEYILSWLHPRRTWSKVNLLPLPSPLFGSAGVTISLPARLHCHRLNSSYGNVSLPLNLMMTLMVSSSRLEARVLDEDALVLSI